MPVPPHLLAILEHMRGGLKQHDHASGDDLAGLAVKQQLRFFPFCPRR